MIEDQVFDKCKHLESIDVDINNNNYCSKDGVLFTKDFNELVLWPQAKDSANYEFPEFSVIFKEAFKDAKKINSINLPESVLEIGQNAFENSSLKEIYIPKNTQKIDISAFNGCQLLSKVNISEDNNHYKTIKDNIVEKPINKLVHCFSTDKVITISSDWYKLLKGFLVNNNNVEKLFIKKEIGIIEVCAISGCENLKEIHIPFSVFKINKDIGVHAFFKCPNLEKIKVTRRNQYYRSIKGVLYNKDVDEIIYYPPAKKGDFIVPSSVKNIDNTTFPEGCKFDRIKFKNYINIKNNINPFWRCDNLKEIVLYKKEDNYKVVDGILYSTKGDKTNDTILISAPASLKGKCTVIDNVVEIASFAFYNSKFNEIILPEGIKKIGFAAFTGCANLTKIKIPESVENIGGANVFEDCSSLKTILIPKHLEDQIWGISESTKVEVYNESSNKQDSSKLNNDEVCNESSNEQVCEGRDSKIDSITDNNTYDKRYTDDEIVNDFLNAWKTFNPELIIKHLDESFEYSSFWVNSSLDFKGYSNYIRKKFNTIKNNEVILNISLYKDNLSSHGMIGIKQGEERTFYRIKIKNGKVVNANISPF